MHHIDKFVWEKKSEKKERKRREKKSLSRQVRLKIFYNVHLKAALTGGVWHLEPLFVNK